MHPGSQPGRLCKMDFAVTRFSWDSPHEWKDRPGTLARRPQCRPSGGAGCGASGANLDTFPPTLLQSTVPAADRLPARLPVQGSGDRR